MVLALAPLQNSPKMVRPSKTFLFIHLRTLSFSADQRVQPNSFPIYRLRTLLQNTGGGGSRMSYKNLFKKSFNRLSDEDSRPERAPVPSAVEGPRVQDFSPIFHFQIS